MAWDTFIDVSGIGVVLLLNLIGALSLVLPGRLDAANARRIGLGRHVEGLLILAFAATVYRGGIGNIPVYIDQNGVVAFSLIGAVLPTVLSLHFLVRAGWARALAAVAGTAAVAVVAYYISQPAENQGIIAVYPDFLLPSVAAAVIGTLVAPGSLRAVPIAYACGSLGALIGGDLVRFDWVVATEKPIAGSFGGAEVFDLVFLAGLWAAAFAAVPLASRWGGMQRRSPAWESIARTAAEGRTMDAVRAARTLTEGSLMPWAEARGLSGRPAWEIRALSFAEPVFGRADDALRLGEFLSPDVARPILVQLEAVQRRLGKPVLPRPAGVRPRVLAGLIDLFPPAVLAIATTWIPTSAPAAAQAYLAITAFIAGHVLIAFFSEWLLQGRTLGKSLLGIRVTRLDGNPPGLWASLVRNLGRLLDLPLLYLIAAAAPAAYGRQRLGDYFAETVVSENIASATDTTRPAAIPTPAIHAMDPMKRAPR